jgi:hypothetical protein
MSKQDRLSFLRGLWIAKVGAQIAERLPVTKTEIKDEAAELLARNGTDDEIRDEEWIGAESQLQFERVRQHESERDSMLTPAERRQLQREIALHGMQSNALAS